MSVRKVLLKLRRGRRDGATLPIYEREPAFWGRPAPRPFRADCAAQHRSIYVAVLAPPAPPLWPCGGKPGDRGLTNPYRTSNLGWQAGSTCLVGTKRYMEAGVVTGEGSARDCHCKSAKTSMLGKIYGGAQPIKSMLAGARRRKSFQ